MVNKKKIELGLSDEEEVDNTSSKNTLSINKNYADRYEKWRNKEEIQKLKDKYGDVDINDSDESTSESEDEEAKELNENVEKEFFKALSLVKSRDARIYDKEKCRFFESPTTSSKANEDEEEDEPKKDSKKDKKAYHLKDLERDMILKKMEKDEDDGNIFEEDDDEEDDEKTEKRKRKMGYYEEQDDLKKSFKDVIKSVDDEDNDFLQVKNKTKEEKDKEEADFIEWLRGKKEKVKDPEVEKSMKYLHDYWNDPNLNEGEKYLRDYILNKRYLFKDEDEEENESDEEVEEKPAKKSKSKDVNESSVTAKGSKDDDDDEKKTTSPLDYVDFSEEESIIENQEEFERKYNFRYEEPDPEFIKSYPRTLADSVRRKKTKRKEKREEYKKRKELEKQRKKEEIKRLKSLKRKEIETKLEKIKKITGNDDLKLTVDDLEKEFDPEEYEKKMQTMFDDQYYEQKDPELNQQEDNDDDKPVFTDDSDEDLKYMSWDNWQAGGKEDQEEEENEDEGEKKKKKKKKKKKDDEDEYQDPEFDMDCEAAENEKAKALKKTKLAQALLKEKPTFDPNEKSFEEYFEEYYKMDCEDVIGGDLPCRFKYREVVANDFGLTVDEILAAKDNELNKWASLKKVIQYRPIQDEIQDTKVYKNRKNQIDFKKKVLTSLFESGEKEDEDEEDEGKDDEKDGELEEKEETKKVEVSNGKEKPKKESEKNKKESKIPNGKKDSETKTTAKNESKSSKANHKHKPKNKNMLESITDERLASFGLNPKKFKKKIKYSGNSKD